MPEVWYIIDTDREDPSEERRRKAMTIREYFDNMRETMDWEEVAEIEYTIYHRWMEEDALDFENWARENGIDLTATEEVMGMTILVTELWGMDMCGD